MDSDKNLTLLSIKAYAKLKGVSDTAIRKQRGKRLSVECFKMEGDKIKGIYKELADVDWVNNFNANYQREVKGTGDKTDKKKTNIETLTEGTASSKNYQEMSKTRKLREDIGLQMDAMKLQEMKGTLVQKSKVYDALFNFGAILRTDLQSLPDELLDHLRALPREEAFDLFCERIDKVLSRFSDPNQTIQI